MNLTGIEISSSAQTMAVSSPGGTSSVSMPSATLGLSPQPYLPAFPSSISSGIAASNSGLLDLIGAFGTSILNSGNIIDILNQLLAEIIDSAKNSVRNLLSSKQGLGFTSSASNAYTEFSLQPIFNNLTSESLDNALREAFTLNLRGALVIGKQSSDVSLSALINSLKENMTDFFKEAGKSLTLSITNNDSCHQPSELFADTFAHFTNQNFFSASPRTLESSHAVFESPTRGATVAPPKPLPYDKSKSSPPRPMNNGRNQTLSRLIHKAYSWMRSMFQKRAPGRAPK